MNNKVVKFIIYERFIFKMNELVLEIKEYFSSKVSSPSKLTKAIKECDEILLKKMENYLEKRPEFEKISYLISAICKNVELKKCLFCGKTLTYTQSRNHNYCSNSCAQRSENVTEKRVKSFLAHKEEINSQKIGRLFYDLNEISINALKMNESRFNANRQDFFEYVSSLGFQIKLDSYSSDLFVINTTIVFSFCGNYWNNIKRFAKSMYY